MIPDFHRANISHKFLLASDKCPRQMPPPASIDFMAGTQLTFDTIAATILRGTSPGLRLRTPRRPKPTGAVTDQNTAAIQEKGVTIDGHRQ
jgi:hypothetical protein